MSADRVRFVPEVVSELKKLGCEKVQQVDAYNSLWLVDGRILISIPLLEKDRCPEAFWPDVLASISKAKSEPAK